MTRACTINEPNIVATMGWHAGMFPPGKTDVALSREVAARFAAAHRVAVDAIRAAAPGVPVGLTLSMTDYQLAPGGEEKLESIRHHSEDIFLDVTDGDDFLGVQVYTRMLIGPDGWAGYEDGVPVLDMGYEFYPASLGELPPAGLGLHRRRRAVAGDRERHRHHGRRAAHRLRAPGARRRARRHRRRHRRARATPTGRCSTTSSGRSATGREFGIVQRRPGDLRPDTQTQRSVARVGGRAGPNAAATAA